MTGSDSTAARILSTGMARELALLRAIMQWVLNSATTILGMVISKVVSRETAIESAMI
jgi:hypothetical protein